MPPAVGHEHESPRFQSEDTTDHVAARGELLQLRPRLALWQVGEREEVVRGEVRLSGPPARLVELVRREQDHALAADDAAEARVAELTALGDVAVQRVDDVVVFTAAERGLHAAADREDVHHVARRDGGPVPRPALGGQHQSGQLPLGHCLLVQPQVVPPGSGPGAGRGEGQELAQALLHGRPGVPEDPSLDLVVEEHDGLLRRGRRRAALHARDAAHTGRARLGPICRVPRLPARLVEALLALLREVLHSRSTPHSRSGADGSSRSCAARRRRCSSCRRARHALGVQHGRQLAV
mmetsp:Transcript_101456/g.316343  ORF Transcript_101456/g.316343 Transcript_101456/m.316343 type:complete len:295 (-) Transcript_101456:516-1400(-)